MPNVSSSATDTPHNRDSPRRFSLPAEEDVLGIEEGTLCNIEYGQWLALQLANRKWAEVGTGVGVALGVITKYVYSILHGPKSCNIEYGQSVGIAVGKIRNGHRLALGLVKLLVS